MNNYERFKGKTAVITGGAEGIGKGVALRLGTEGATVLLLDINEKLLQKTEKEFTDAGIACKTYIADVSKEDNIVNVFNEITQSFTIDILINAAGIVGPTSTNITKFETEDFDKVYNVNLKGAFLVTKYALQHMKQRGEGRVLLIASIAGKEGNPGMVAYSATKSGVIGLVKSVGKEFADTNITINGLAPAVIKTTMNENTSPEQLAYMLAKIPMRRLGTIEEVAAMSCFIVSDENSFSTGFVYDISGGRATY